MAPQGVVTGPRTPGPGLSSPWSPLGRLCFSSLGLRFADPPLLARGPGRLSELRPMDGSRHWLVGIPLPTGL